MAIQVNFDDLPITMKANILDKFGVHLASDHHPYFSYQLFAVHSVFIEVYIKWGTATSEVHYIRTAKADDLIKYLNHIHLSNV